MALPIALTNIFKHKQKSYKMVLILCLLDELKKGNSSVTLDTLKQKFLDYYQAREAEGLVVDPPPTKLGKQWREITLAQIHHIIQTTIQALSPILINDRDYKEYGFRPDILEELRTQEIQELNEYTTKELENYYSQLNRSIPLRDYLNSILSTYLENKRQPFKENDLGKLMRHTIPNNISKLPFFSDEWKAQGSVGQGNWADVPWIAIMDKKITTTTQQGVYVVYLFSQDMSAVYLTLAQGVTEPLKRGKTEGYEYLRRKVQEIRSVIALDGFQKDENIHLTTKGIGEVYQVSTIAYAKYAAGNLPSNQQLLTDLHSMLEYYQEYVDYILSEDTTTTNESNISPGKKEPLIVHDSDVLETIETIKTYIRKRGFHYPDHLIENFYLSIKTKPFVILAGISGTGKTKLVKLFAEAIGATSENRQFRLIPVRPDWSDPSDLIGYKDITGTFRPGPLTEVLVEASNPANEDKVYFICLDEMNLARVEHYFSDILSLMETQERKDDGRIITNPLISTNQLGEDDRVNYEGLFISSNVVLIGTVNMDETTHPFSKKVLDRGNTIEFNYIQLDNFPDDDEIPEPDTKQGIAAAFLSSDYITLQEAYKDYSNLIKESTEKLIKVNLILENIHAHIGFRVRDAICFYMVYNERFRLMTEDEAFDFQFLQKILPRIQGSNLSVKRTLIELLKITLGDSQLQVDDLMGDASLLYEIDLQSVYPDAPYKQSSRKLLYMLRRLEEDGFTSFWIS
ncbi:MrcB family domain-containing protein [Brevibacillus panacihumi]|uniref:MrcB family domain-containing protein n=1 Tax=Brevibacillus panacihumi TaxID=497735 RepID=UPI003D06B841